MTIFLIRDDDLNATTDIHRLERAYAPLLDAGIPISFATIPDVALDTRAPDGSRERFIHHTWPDVDAHAMLGDGSPVALWLRAHHDAVDVLQHGLSHRRVRGGTEMGDLGAREARERIALGHEILRRAIGRAPSGFVAPWDRLSPGSFKAACEAYPLLSTSWVDRHMLPALAWPRHAVERLGRSEALPIGDTWVLRHRGGLITPTLAPSDVTRTLFALADRARVTVIVLHHWMFWDDPDPHPVITELARTLRGQTCIPAHKVRHHLGPPRQPLPRTGEMRPQPAR